MLVTSDNPDLKIVYDASKTCFGCHQPLNDKCKIEWHGSSEDGGTISFALHAGCAAKLALHLASDALKADLANGRHDLDHGTPLP